MVLKMFDIKESLTNQFGTFPLLQEYSCREKMTLDDFGLLKSEGSNVYIIQDRTHQDTRMPMWARLQELSIHLRLQYHSQ